MSTGLSEEAFDLILQKIKKENHEFKIIDDSSDLEDITDERQKNEKTLRVPASNLQRHENKNLCVNWQTKNIQTRLHLPSNQSPKTISTSTSRNAHMCNESCNGYFCSLGTLDKPKNIGELQTIERKKSILKKTSDVHMYNETEKKIGAEFSVDHHKISSVKRLRNNNYIVKSKGSSKILRSCSVRKCCQNSVHVLSENESKKILKIFTEFNFSINIDDSIYLSTSIGRKQKISLSFCEEHLCVINVITLCQLCSNKVEKLGFEDYKMYDHWNSILLHHNILLTLQPGMFICLTCKSCITDNDFLSPVNLKCLQENVEKKNSERFKTFVQDINVNLPFNNARTPKVHFSDPLVTSTLVFERSINKIQEKKEIKNCKTRPNNRVTKMMNKLKIKDLNGEPEIENSDTLINSEPEIENSDTAEPNCIIKQKLDKERNVSECNDLINVKLEKESYEESENDDITIIKSEFDLFDDNEFENFTFPPNDDTTHIDENVMPLYVPNLIVKDEKGETLQYPTKYEDEHDEMNHYYSDYYNISSDQGNNSLNEEKRLIVSDVVSRADSFNVDDKDTIYLDHDEDDQYIDEPNQHNCNSLISLESQIRSDPVKLKKKIHDTRSKISNTSVKKPRMENTPECTISIVYNDGVGFLDRIALDHKNKITVSDYNDKEKVRSSELNEKIHDTQSKISNTSVKKPRMKNTPECSKSIVYNDGIGFLDRIALDHKNKITVSDYNDKEKVRSSEINEKIHDTQSKISNTSVKKPRMKNTPECSKSIVYNDGIGFLDRIALDHKNKITVSDYNDKEKVRSSEINEKIHVTRSKISNTSVKKPRMENTPECTKSIVYNNGIGFLDRIALDHKNKITVSDYNDKEKVRSSELNEKIHDTQSKISNTSVKKPRMKNTPECSKSIVYNDGIGFLDRIALDHKNKITVSDYNDKEKVRSSEINEKIHVTRSKISNTSVKKPRMENTPECTKSIVYNNGIGFLDRIALDHKNKITASDYNDKEKVRSSEINEKIHDARSKISNTSVKRPRMENTPECTISIVYNDGIGFLDRIALDHKNKITVSDYNDKEKVRSSELNEKIHDTQSKISNTSVKKPRMKNTPECSKSIVYNDGIGFLDRIALDHKNKITVSDYNDKEKVRSSEINEKIHDTRSKISNTSVKKPRMKNTAECSKSIVYNDGIGFLDKIALDHKNKITVSDYNDKEKVRSSEKNEKIPMLTSASDFEYSNEEVQELPSQQSNNDVQYIMSSDEDKMSSCENPYEDVSTTNESNKLGLRIENSYSLNPNSCPLQFDRTLRKVPFYFNNKLHSSSNNESVDNSVSESLNHSYSSNFKSKTKPMKEVRYFTRSKKKTSFIKTGIEREFWNKAVEELINQLNDSNKPEKRLLKCLVKAVGGDIVDILNHLLKNQQKLCNGKMIVSENVDPEMTPFLKKLLERLKIIEDSSDVDVPMHSLSSPSLGISSQSITTGVNVPAADIIPITSNSIARPKSIIRSVPISSIKIPYHSSVGSQKTAITKSNDNIYSQFIPTNCIEKPVSQPMTIVCQPRFTVRQPRPIVRQPGFIVSQPRPIVCQPRPIVCQPRPIVCQPRSIVCQPRSIVCQPRPIVCQPRPIVCQPRPIVSQPRLIVIQPMPIQRPMSIGSKLGALGYLPDSQLPTAVRSIGLSSVQNNLLNLPNLNTQTVRNVVPTCSNPKYVIVKRSNYYLRKQ